jgi:hypothetical protein
MVENSTFNLKSSFHYNFVSLELLVKKEEVRSIYLPNYASRHFVFQGSFKEYITSE